MTIRHCYFTLIVLAFAVLHHSGLAQDRSARVALLIGNARYLETTSPLLTTIPDTGAVTEEFRLHGFDIDQKENLGAQEMRGAVNAFLNRISRGTTALFYFNGYGIQVGRQTFLLPVDAQISSEDAVRRDGINVGTLLAEMNRRGAKVKIVIIDAARRNPYEFRIRTSPAGLAGIDTPEGTIAMYSTSPGKVVTDGSGMTSTFAAELIRELRFSERPIEEIFNRTRVAVARVTNNEQVPWIATSLVEQFYLNQAGAGVAATTLSPRAAPPAQPMEPYRSREPQFSTLPAPAAPSDSRARSQQPPTASESAQAWLAVKDTTSPELLEGFLQRHGDSINAGQARARLEALKRGGARPQVAAGTSDAPDPERRASGTRHVRSQPLSTARERGLKAGNRFHECSKCPEMVVVPSGNFIMGSPGSEPGHVAEEEPQRSIYIATTFAAGRFAVSFEEWDACVADGGCNGYSPSDEGGRRGRYPVTDVSWNDAKAYTAWLSKTTGKTYRLLSEAEREYVTRAGTTSPFWFGNTVSSKQANYDASVNFSLGEKGESRKRTLPVEFFAPNAFGLYQVHGNVAEWTEDCWRPSYLNAPSDGSARTQTSCGERTLRGGSYLDGAAALRSAARTGAARGIRAGNVGFRVARSL